MSRNSKAIIYTDGGARGNPGPAGVGYVIYDEKKNIVYSEGIYIGEATNNQAEYLAVSHALAKATDFGFNELEFYLDSELVVNQLSQKFKIKNSELAKLFVKIWNQSQVFKNINYTHIPREKNKLADSLVNQAIDLALKQKPRL